LNVDLVCAASDRGVPATVLTLDARAGPIHLDLNGHSITCTSRFLDTGITVLGSGVHLRGGTVEECFNGIILQGGGKHHLSGLIIRFNNIVGLGLRDSQDNHISNSEISSTLNRGIGLTNSHHNQFKDLLITTNSKFGGISLVGSDNALISSTVLNNGLGFPAPGSLLSGGVHVEGSRNNVSNNVVVGNSNGVVLVTGSDNIIEKNEVRNSQHGISLLVSAILSQVKDNHSVGNAVFDLEDQNPSCDQNEWKGNTFGTANQPCVE